jgi:glycosyltransferase involved in cell wall biosynthesis
MKDGVVRAGFPAEKVSVIPNSADLDLFNPEKADGRRFRREHPEIGDAPLVVYAGAMGKINGVDYLPWIASASKERGLGLQLAVIGKNGQEERKVRDTARKLNVLGDNFHIYPSVPKKMMPGILAAAEVALSLFVDLKPMWANSANKFFDALGSGTPVAINYGGWQADLLEETGAGIVLPPDDPDKAASMLAAFVADEEVLQKAGQAARNLAEQRFSRDKLASQLERALISALP